MAVFASVIRALMSPTSMHWHGCACAGATTDATSNIRIPIEFRITSLSGRGDNRAVESNIHFRSESLMNLSTRVKAILIGAALVAPTACLAQANMREGNWEVTVKMEMVGMPFAMPAQIVNQCVTNKDLVPDMSQQDQSCIVREQKVVGDTVSWRMQCKGRD
ncbi:MAG: DUF3617 domain-containing protein, partial [Burkholderiales bacterium]